MLRHYFFILLAFINISIVHDYIVRDFSGDHTSPDAVIATLYQSISFGKGEEPDWDRLRTLFIPDARLIHAANETYTGMSVETFISQFKNQLSAGTFSEFKEYEIHRVTESFGDILHAFSTYQADFITPKGSMKARGINSIQLIKKEGRWLVATILWYDEHPELTIPGKYLPH